MTLNRLLTAESRMLTALCPLMYSEYGLILLEITDPPPF